MTKYITLKTSYSKFLTLLILGLLLPSFGRIGGGLFSQDTFNQDPNNPNLDFSKDDFTNWELTWGPRINPVHFSGASGVSSPVIVQVYGNNWDGNAGIGNLKRVPDGLQRVARYGDPAGSGLGNERSYRLKYNITVNAGYPVLFIQLASIMDQTHGIDANTHYKFALKTASGDYVPAQPCTGMELSPTDNTNPVAHSTPQINYTLQVNPSGNYAYQPWESIAIDLSAYVGQTLSLEFIHYDCGFGVHGSYTYFSAGMQSPYRTFYFCEGANEVMLDPYIPNFKSYLWSTGATTESITVSNPVNGTVYTCEAESYNGCTTTFTYTIEKVITDADFNFSFAADDCNQIHFYDQSATNYQDIVSWQWDFGNPPSGTGNTSSLQNPSHTYPGAGTYNVSLTVTDTFGCMNTVTTQLTVATFDENLSTTQNYLNQSPVSFCEGDNPEAQVQALLDYIYSQHPGILIDKTAQEIASEFTQNSGQVAVSVSKNNRCGSQTLLISYQIYSLPVLVPLVDNAVIGVCLGNEGFYNFFDLTPAGLESLGNLNPGAYTIGYYLSEVSARTGDESSQGYISDPSSFANTVAFGQTLWIRIENNNTGCYAVRSFEVKVFSSYDSTIKSFSGNILCVDFLTDTVLNPIELFTEVPSDEYNFQWYLNGTAISYATTPAYTATAQGDYTVEIISIDPGACLSVFSEVFTITQSGPASVTGEGYILNQIGQTPSFSITVAGYGQYEYSFTPYGPWQSSNSFSAGAGIYTVFVRDTTTDSPCEITQVGNIFVIGYPKFFTPNGDGINDYWRISGLQSFHRAEIYIFDRYGKLLKQLKPSEQGWDGTYKRERLPATDYWFKLLYNSSDLNGNIIRKEFKAHFSLKR